MQAGARDRSVARSANRNIAYVADIYDLQSRERAPGNSAALDFGFLCAIFSPYV
jgi:hypothetical protein